MLQNGYQSSRRRLEILIAEIEVDGPVRGNWRNYSKLEGTKNLHHCHIKTGRPTSVAVWEETDKSIQLVEVFRKATVAEKGLHDIYGKLGISATPGGIQKLTM